jgi:hypothetical protein
MGQANNAKGERTKGRRRPLCVNVHALLIRIFGGSLDVAHVVKVAPNVRTHLKNLASGRPVTAEDVVYALLSLARGDTSTAIAEKFRAAKMTGLSRATLEKYAKRALDADPRDIGDLLRICTPPGRYDRSLSRTLVDHLEVCTKRSAAPRSKARWRAWTLLEITFFVLTGKWPPRAVWTAVEDVEYKKASKPKFKDWQDDTRALCYESGAAPSAENLQDWEELQALARDEELEFEGEPLAPDATREAVRVALNTGARPQKNTQEHRGLGASATRPNWVDKRGRGRPRKNQRA